MIFWANNLPFFDDDKIHELLGIACKKDPPGIVRELEIYNYKHIQKVYTQDILKLLKTCLI